MVSLAMKCRFAPITAIIILSSPMWLKGMKLDITNLDAIRAKVKENDIQVIVNCAAYTNVDKAESDFDLANLLNNTAAGNLAEAMKEVDGTLIHVSTDYVFQGDRNIPCKEDWETNPLGVYGKTKLAGEKHRGYRLQAYHHPYGMALLSVG